jgi:hypothetical protein
MPNTSAIRVSGLRELQSSLAKVNRDVKKELALELKAVGEPVRAAAEQLATANISHIGPVWERMRLGVTTKVVYVAPATRRKLGSPRPNLAGLLMDKAMQPALDQNAAGIEAALEVMLDRISIDSGF